MPLKKFAASFITAGKENGGGSLAVDANEAAHHGDPIDIARISGSRIAEEATCLWENLEAVLELNWSTVSFFAACIAYQKNGLTKVVRL